MNEPEVYPNLEVVTPEDRAELREALIGLESRRALAFQTAAVREFGPAGGIFARQLLFWDGKGRDPEGWIYKSMAEWQEETGLSRGEQEKARKRLAGTGKNNGKPVLEEKKAVGPDGRWRLFYRLDLAALMERVGEYLKPDEVSKPSTSTPVCSLNQTGSVSGLVDDDDAHLNVPAIQKSSHKRTQRDSPQTPRNRGARKVRKRERTDDAPATPAVAIEAIRAHTILSMFWRVATEHNFTDPAPPTGRLWMSLGGDDRERGNNANRLRSIARRAVREGHQTEGSTPTQPDEGAQTDAQREDRDIPPALMAELERLLNGDTHTARLAAAVVAGKRSPAGEITPEHVAEALREELNLADFGLDALTVAGIVLDQLRAKASV